MMVTVTPAASQSERTTSASLSGAIRSGSPEPMSRASARPASIASAALAAL